LDAISIALPTHLHPELSCLALARGVHVLCEKPMALDADACGLMIEAAKASGKILQIGHCVRFWPEYAVARDIVEGGEYGRVLSASFRRLTARPGWSQDNWLGDLQRSGGMELDLHIHDTDYIQYLLGRPQAVHSWGVCPGGGGIGHIMTRYVYEDGAAVLAEGGWIFKSSFGFEMSFNIALEGATLIFDCTRDPAFRVCPSEGEAFTPELPEGDGYARQIDHFIRAIHGEDVPPVLSLASARDSVKIVTAERESVLCGDTIVLNWK
jgi:predicted dehydrogenase